MQKPKSYSAVTDASTEEWYSPQQPTDKKNTQVPENRKYYKPKNAHNI